MTTQSTPVYLPTPEVEDPNKDGIPFLNVEVGKPVSVLFCPITKAGKLPFFAHKKHFGLGVNGLICPTSFGKPCPICDKAVLTRKSAAEIDKKINQIIYARQKYAYNVIPNIKIRKLNPPYPKHPIEGTDIIFEAYFEPNDAVKELKIYRWETFKAKAQLDNIKSGFGDFYCPACAYQIQLSSAKVNSSKDGKEYKDTTLMALPQRVVWSKELLDLLPTMPQIDESMEKYVKSTEELQSILNTFLASMIATNAPSSNPPASQYTVWTPPVAPNPVNNQVGSGIPIMGGVAPVTIGRTQPESVPTNIPPAVVANPNVPVSASKPVDPLDVFAATVNSQQGK